MDDLFVAQARIHEPSAAERQQTAQQMARRARRIGRQQTARRWLPHAALAVVIFAICAAAVVTPGPTLAVPANRVVVLVASIAEEPPGTTEAARHETHLAIRWLETQTDKVLRADLAEVETVRIPASMVEGATVEEATDRLLTHVRESRSPAELPVIVTTFAVGGTDLAGAHACGMGGPGGVVVFPPNCDTRPSANTPSFGGGVNLIIAHELVHAMGGVDDCAPHARDGHVTDDASDLMATSHLSTTTSVTLDAAGDDYLSRDAPVCRDIRDSPLWER